MRDSHSSGQESICILLSAPCKGKLLSILFPDRVENEYIHQLSSCRPRPKAELFCSVLAKTSHLTKAWKMGLPVSSSWICFSMTRLVNWGYTRATSFAIFSSLSKALISTASPRWNVFTSPLAIIEWHFHLETCVHSTWKDLGIPFFLMYGYPSIQLKQLWVEGTEES